MRRTERDIKESQMTLGSGSCIIVFMSHSSFNEIDCDMHVNCSVLHRTVKEK